MRKYILQIAASLLLCCLCKTPLNAQLPSDMDRYIDSVLAIFEVPGISIAVVKDDQVLLTQGYGIKHIGETPRVDAHTLFPIASNTKAFTAMALAILVDQGKIKWDEPVINYLPWFRMSDPWVTAQITVRDLLVHHSGIPAYSGDVFLFPPSTYTRRAILEKLKTIPIVNSFRTTYAYDNILYAAAGEVIAEVSKMDWQDFVKVNILDKVGMNESISRFSALNSKLNIATPHVRSHDKIIAADQFLLQEIGDAGDPAGGISSNAVDMAKWLLTELDSARKTDQKRLIPATAFKELWDIITPINVPVFPDVLKPAQPNFYGYASGVRVSNYDRYKVISHGGKLDGAVSHVLLIPDLKLGIAVLTNQESSGAYMSIIYHLLDHYMERPYHDWIGSYKQLLDSSLADDEKEWKKTVIISSLTTPIFKGSDKYTGTYKDAFYGDINITKESTGLYIKFAQTPQLTGQLFPVQYETFKAVFKNPALKADAYIYFTLGANGNAESFKLKVIDPSSDISFSGLEFAK